MSYKPTPDYSQQTRKDLIDLILTHNLTELYTKSEYSLSNTDSPLEATHIGCKYAYYGDYCGDTVTRSNQSDLYNLFKDHGAIEEHGAYYSIFTLIPLSALKKWKKDTLIQYLETLDSLTDYPLIDDETLSTLESDLFTESWDSYISSDILSALSKLLEIDSDTFIDHIEAQRLYDLSQDLNEPDYLYLPDPTIKTWRSEPHTPLTLLEAYQLYQEQTSDYPLYEDAVSAYVNTSAVAKWIHDNTTIIHAKISA
jgi:hypothetical protein